MQELLVNADGNDQDYMCALKLAITRSTDEQKTLPQSARSRCVRPSAITQGLECLLAEAKWNEVFIFELPEKVLCSEAYIHKNCVVGLCIEKRSLVRIFYRSM